MSLSISKIILFIYQKFEINWLRKTTIAITDDVTIFTKNILDEVIYRNYANGRLRFSTSDIASVRAIRGWCYCRCVAYLTALQSVAICWVACTCNIHPTVGSLAAPSARHYGVDPVMETHPTSSPFHLPPTHCASHVKRTYDVPLHAGNSTASATIICHLNRLNSRRRVRLCHDCGKDAAKLGSRDARAPESSSREFQESLRKSLNFSACPNITSKCHSQYLWLKNAHSSSF